MRLFFLLLWLLPAVAAGEVVVREYPIPRGLYAHDVWADPAPDGPVYFSAQSGGRLGILEPKSGKVETVALGRGAAPHGVLQGADGAVWLTDGGQNAIVRVDPKTRAVKAFPLPRDSGYANLNTAAFDGGGTLWFTGQSGIYGRLDPRSGELKVFDAPKGRGPYGIQATPQGTVYFASLAGSYVGRINSNGSVSVIQPPTPDQGARRVWSDSKGNLWVSEWSSGKLGRYEPASGKWTEWQAPGSSPRLYAVYVDEEDKVWTSEWSAQVMLRFDPASAKFAAYKSSSGSPAVRQIHGRKGEVWTPESGADKLVVYKYQ
ncbi:MAG TPA: lyase [Burkholderiales bacterium]|nr:lyase [Burkholderiales bacterium]